MSAAVKKHRSVKAQAVPIMSKSSKYVACRNLILVCGFLFWLPSLWYTVVSGKTYVSTEDWKGNGTEPDRRRFELDLEVSNLGSGTNDLATYLAAEPKVNTPAAIVNPSTARLLPEPSTEIKAPAAGHNTTTPFAPSILESIAKLDIPTAAVNAADAPFPSKTAENVNPLTVPTLLKAAAKAIAPTASFLPQPTAKFNSSTATLPLKATVKVNVFVAPGVTERVNASATSDPSPVVSVPTNLSATAKVKVTANVNALASSLLAQSDIVDGGLYQTCALRDEWRSVCLPNISASAHRYLLVGPLKLTAGIGHFLAVVGYLTRLSVRYNLQMVLGTPLVNRDGKIHDTFGLSAHPSFLNGSHPDVQKAELEVLPGTSRHGREEVLAQGVNRTWVKYDPQPSGSSCNGNWTSPIPGVGGPDECNQPRFLLRDWFWRAPHHRTWCDRYLPRGGTYKGKWVIAVHLRRGDIVNSKRESWQKRNVPHGWYEQILKKVLGAISEVEAGAKVVVLVFSQGKNGNLVNEWGDSVKWNVGDEGVCKQFGLECVHTTVLDSTPVEALECLIGADVMVGSRSGFSHLAGMLSSNVKVVPQMWHEYAPQDSLTIREVNITAVDSGLKHSTLVDLLRTWQRCGSYAMARGNPFVRGYRINLKGLPE